MVLLTIWAFIMPVKVALIESYIGVNAILYTGLYPYQSAGINSLEYPLSMIMYIVIMLPFCAPGFIMAGLVWHGSRDEHKTRLQYYGLVVMLLVIQTLLVMIIPCPISSRSIVLCFPTPTTGFLALFLISRIVKEPVVAWSEPSGNDQAFMRDAAAE
jgi:hypothetical protein